MAQGWQNLLLGYPWFEGKGNYPITAYSEFMPPPRVGQKPYGSIDHGLYREDDPFGWHITEYEEALEIPLCPSGIVSNRVLCYDFTAVANT